MGALVAAVGLVVAETAVVAADGVVRAAVVVADEADSEEAAVLGADEAAVVGVEARAAGVAVRMRVDAIR